MYKDPRLNNKFHVSFRIHGFECSPDELTKQLGIKPTATLIKGEYRIIGRGKFERKRLNKENAWVLESEISRSKSLEEHLEHLLAQIRPHKEKLKQITNKYYTEFSCGIYYYEANPGVQFDNKLLTEVAGLGTLLDLDIYCLAGTVSQFEQANADKKLTKQLSQIKTVTKLSDAQSEEPQVLANSLIEIDAARNNLEMHMEDAVVWDDLTDKEYKEKMSRVIEDLKKILKAIKQSKYLSSLIDE